MKQDTRKLYLEDGTPRYVRVFDDGGETFDRYTAVFTGRYKGRPPSGYIYAGMSARPFDPQGFGQHGEVERRAFGTGAHCGKRIKFSSLPPGCQTLVRQDYISLWECVDPVLKNTLGETEK
jgi:hypothetical protein